METGHRFTLVVGYGTANSRTNQFKNIFENAKFCARRNTDVDSITLIGKTIWPHVEK